MNLSGLDHISLHISNLNRSVQFYGEILKLKAVRRPDFSFNGAWFEFPDKTQIHLIEGRKESVLSGNRSTHFALKTKSIVDFVLHLEEKDYPIEIGPKVRIDGNDHLFVKDPDGYFIEIVA